MAATKTVSSESTKAVELSALPASPDEALRGSPRLFDFLETLPRPPLRCQYPWEGVPLPASPGSTPGQGESRKGTWWEGGHGGKLQA